jgi:hypothetical protein
MKTTEAVTALTAPSSICLKMYSIERGIIPSIV